MTRDDQEITSPVVRFFQYLADVAPVRDRRGAVMAATLVALLLALTAIVVFQTDGTGHAFLHLAYVPVIIASLALGLVGGVITALVAGLGVLGPLMPLDVSAGEMQSIGNFAYRTLFLLLVALATGSFGESMRQRRAAAERSQVRLERLYSRNLRLFANLVSERDRETADHCERVAHNCVLVGRSFGMSDEELNNLYWSGMLHDLGKLSVPEAILQKPTSLTPEEFETVKRHSKVGADFLTSLSLAFQPIADGVRWHHERWDGTGYPEGLSGTDIPLAARILAVVDVFEAVTSERPYHHAISNAEALELIRQGSGSHFDPEVVRVFEDLVGGGQLVSADESQNINFDAFFVELTHA